MLMLMYFLLAIGVSFLCSILEAVLLSITISHIELVKEKDKQLGLLMESQKNNIDFSIAAILTLNTFAHTLGAAGVGAEAARLFGEEYMFYISFVLTLLILILSEIIPKTLGAFYWKNLAGFATKVIRVLILITYPLLVIMNKITIFIAPKEQESITKEELIATANIAEEKGILKEKESSIIENLLKLHSIKVKDILTPRSVMFCVKEEDVLRTLKGENLLDMDKFKEYSRVPVYKDSIDDIVGLIISKELFYEMIENKLEDKKQIIKSVSSINENVPVAKLIDIFLAKKEHMLIVCDSYGQTEGVVTLEDAVETLLGMEIVDELDSNVDMREVARAKMLKHRAQKLRV